MIFRRIIAGILVFVFIISAQAAFLVFAVTNTFLSADFYNNKLSEESYNFMVNATVKNLFNENAFIENNFTEADLRREITAVFPKTVYDKMLNQLIRELDTLKEDPSKPLTLKLGTYRESLLTLTHNLSYRVFESIQKCEEGEIPEETEGGLPSCVPPMVEYNIVAEPFIEEFEIAIYSAVPEQVQIDLNASVGQNGFMLSNVFQVIDILKIVIYGLLLGSLIFIVLLIWKQFASILSYLGLAFFVGGLSAVIVSFLLPALSPVVAQKINGELLIEDIRILTDKIFFLFGVEIQKGAYIFLALGALLILTRLFIKKR